jgi:hypothetical protein
MKVTITHASPHGVHDGLGGVHRQGESPDLPEDVAQMLIERGMAKVAADGPPPAEAPPPPPAKELKK